MREFIPTLQSFEMSLFLIFVWLSFSSLWTTSWKRIWIWNCYNDYEVIRVLKVDGDGDEQSQSEMRRIVPADWEL
jgi:hypothetical protein